MLLGCLFDVHGNLPALEAVLEDARGCGAERFILGGDYSAFGGWPAECVAVLAELEAEVRLRGNWERWVDDPPPDVLVDEETMHAAEAVRAALGDALVSELGALPVEVRFGRTLVCHASPGSDMKGFTVEPSEADAALLAGVDAPRLMFGHTHKQFRREAGSGAELVNPGSVGMPLDGDQRAAWALMHPSGFVELRRVAYDVGAAIDGIQSRYGDAPWAHVIVGRLESASME
jgi:diadenosine tetraphosphatase ApaH/serine/threonine PP2A family protein phosphatase